MVLFRSVLRPSLLPVQVLTLSLECLSLLLLRSNILAELGYSRDQCVWGDVLCRADLFLFVAFRVSMFAIWMDETLLTTPDVTLVDVRGRCHRHCGVSNRLLGSIKDTEFNQVCIIRTRTGFHSGVLRASFVKRKVLLSGIEFTALGQHV